MDSTRNKVRQRSMPVVFRHHGYRFFFYSNEGDPQESLHIHVRRGDAMAKFWLRPMPAVAESYGLDGRELRDLLDVAVDHAAEIERYWHDHFGD